MESENTPHRWYTLPYDKEDDVCCETLASAALSRVHFIESKNQSIFDRMRNNETRYQSEASIYHDQYSLTDADYKADAPLTMPIGKILVDSGYAMIARYKYKPTFQTRGADYAQQQMAKSLDRFMPGAFEYGKAYKQAPLSRRDAMIYGTGALRQDICEHDDTRVSSSRVLPYLIIVDESLCANGSTEPPELFQATLVTRAAILEQHPDVDRQRLKDTATFYSLDGEEQVRVYEGWWVGAGKHVYVKFAGNCLLDHRDWTLPLPFIFQYWTPPLNGFYGTGMMGDVAGHQDRINQMYAFIKQSQDQFLTPLITTDDPTGTVVGKKIVDSDGRPTRQRGTILATKTPGSKVEVKHNQSVSPETYASLDRLIAGAHNIAGISTYSSSGQVPAGLNSAPAQREYSSKETQRFAMQSLDYEDVFIQLAHQYVAFYAQINKGKSRSKIPFKERNWVTEIPWPDIDIDRDAFIISINSSSFDTLTPSGRIQLTLELIQAGFTMGPQEARSLLGWPDTERSDYFNNAQIDYADSVIQVLMSGEFPANPTPYLDLAFLFSRVRAAFIRETTPDLYGKVQMPDTVQDSFVTYLTMVQGLIDTGKAQTTMPVGPDGQVIAGASAEATQGIAAPFAGGRTSVAGLGPKQ